jgi:hypothetical protein
VEKSGFDTATGNITLGEGDTKTMDFVLTPPGQKAGAIKGKVVDAGGAAVEGATVTAGKQKSTSAADGSFRFDIVAGEHDVKASKAGYVEARETVTLGAGEEKEVTLRLEAKPGSDIMSMSVAGIPLIGLIVALLALFVAAAAAMALMKRRGGGKCQYCSAKLSKGAFSCGVCGAPVGGPSLAGPEQPTSWPGPGSPPGSEPGRGYANSQGPYVQPPDR